MSKSSETKPSRREDNRDVVVVGAGLGGLATAARLAAAGLRVTVCERAQHPGGRGRTSVREGFSLNLGAHALYRSGPAMALLRELGIEPRGRMPSGRGAVLRAGREHALPATPVSLLSTSILDLRSKFALVGLFSRLRRIDTASLRHVSAEAWLAQQCSSVALRELMTAIVRLSTYCGDLDHLSAEAAIEQVRLALRGGGVLYLDGGWEQLVDALVERGRADGVEYRFGARVEAIARADQARWAVQVDGSVIPCDQVVIASSPGVADSLLAPLLGHSSFAATARPCTAAVLDLGLRGEWPGPRFVLDLDEPTYLSVHSDVAALAPAGHTLLSLIWYRRGGEEQSAAQLRERLERHVRRWMPNFEQAVVVDQFLPNITVANDLPQASRGGLTGRAPGQVDEGLHLVGDWVGDRGVLFDASMASATRACESITGSWHGFRSSGTVADPLQHSGAPDPMQQ
jgi:phytoene dehydrogenase-like protein